MVRLASRRAIALTLILGTVAGIGRAAAIALGDPLIGALLGTLVFLPLLVLAAPLIERPAQVPVRIRNSSRLVSPTRS